MYMYKLPIILCECFIAHPMKKSPDSPVIVPYG